MFYYNRPNLGRGMQHLPESCEDFMNKKRKPFEEAQGSSAVHQAYKGGYLDHLDEVFGIAAILYRAFDEHRCMPFLLSDVYQVLWLHDIEKVWKYSRLNRFRSVERWMAKHHKHGLTVKVVEECNLTLNDEQWNALKYVHGENEDYVSGEAQSRPLGAFCHMCDYWSARGWKNEPMKSGPLRV